MTEEDNQKLPLELSKFPFTISVEVKDSQRAIKKAQTRQVPKRNSLRTSQNTIRINKRQQELYINSTFTLLDPNIFIRNVSTRKPRTTFDQLSIRNKSNGNTILPKLRFMQNQLEKPSKGFKEFVEKQQKEANKSTLCDKENDLDITLTKMPKRLNQLLNVRWKKSDLNNKVPRMIFRNLYSHMNTKN